LKDDSINHILGIHSRKGLGYTLFDFQNPAQIPSNLQCKCFLFHRGGVLDELVRVNCFDVAIHSKYEWAQWNCSCNGV